MPASLVWLAIGAFAIGTEGLMIAGLLPAIAADFHSSVATAGQLITIFALAARRSCRRCAAASTGAGC